MNFDDNPSEAAFRAEARAWIARGAELHRIDPVTVPQAIDTTGAGDAFAGSLAQLYTELRAQAVAHGSAPAPGAAVQRRISRRS